MQELINLRLPILYRRCLKLQQEIVSLSGLSEDDLADAHSELRECIAIWKLDHKDQGVGDPYDCLCFVMTDWESPWPANEVSSLNGLKQSQFFLSFAYGEVEEAMNILVQRPAKGNRAMPATYGDDDAACFVLYAGKAYAQAKQIITSGQDGVAQLALDLSTDDFKLPSLAQLQLQ